MVAVKSDAKAFIRGGVYLARLDPVKAGEVGKLRPVVLLTAQEILEDYPPLVFICPLSSHSDPTFTSLHLRLPSRGGLQVESFALVEHCRAVSIKRIQSDCLAQLEYMEMRTLIHRLMRMVGA